MLDRIARATAQLTAAHIDCPLGHVRAASGARVAVAGLGATARLGDRLRIGGATAEVVRIEGDEVVALADAPLGGLGAGAAAVLDGPLRFAPSDDWLGRVIDPDGRPLDGRPLLPGLDPRPVDAAPPDPGTRRPLGARLATGHAAFDTLLPLARGQRIGLFAGSGVGKSTLLGALARRVEADVVVIGLVGERGRELRHFLDDVLGADGLARAVVVTATSDRAPQVRRRCAGAATAVAEHFRDAGKQVLLLIDSVTRFAESHREIAAAAGEPGILRGFPATTPSAIAALCERAGPGGEGQGDVTAIYSVLVQGSDMDEPVADWLRGVLDGHVVLDRAIAERGRFPAIDAVRSVSRSLPGCASAGENALLTEARARMGAYARAEAMIRAGLYQPGADPAVDAAVAVRDGLERVMAITDAPGVEASFAALRAALAPGRAGSNA